MVIKNFLSEMNYNYKIKLPPNYISTQLAQDPSYFITKLPYYPSYPVHQLPYYLTTQLSNHQLIVDSENSLPNDH